LLCCVLVQAAVTTNIHAQSRSVVVGHVTDQSGVPVPGVEVRVVRSGVSTITGDSGGFRLEGLTPGRQELSLRKLGFAPRTFTIDVLAADSTVVALSLERRVQVLAADTIEAARVNRRLAQTGFEERRKAGFAPQSQFITREDIERENPIRLSDMFKRMAGRAQQCKDAGTVFLDGVLTMQPTAVYALQTARARRQSGRYDAIDFVSPVEVAGVEVYVGAQVPSQFNITRRPTGDRMCVVAIWTR
jgi:Carboxypeptidase regulatory-like domain